jgi:hypothetical protein
VFAGSAEHRSDGECRQEEWDSESFHLNLMEWSVVSRSYPAAPHVNRRLTAARARPKRRLSLEVPDAARTVRLYPEVEGVPTPVIARTNLRPYDGEQRG